MTSKATILLIIGGSDTGISAAYRTKELDPEADVGVVVAVVLLYDMTVDTLCDLDLSCALPLSGPWDPVRKAGPCSGWLKPREKFFRRICFILRVHFCTNPGDTSGPSKSGLRYRNVSYA